MKSTFIILKLQIGIEYSPQFQKLLASWACAIKNKICLHNDNTLAPTTYGFMILQIIENNEIIKLIKNDIAQFDRIDMKIIQF